MTESRHGTPCSADLQCRASGMQTANWVCVSSAVADSRQGENRGGPSGVPILALDRGTEKTPFRLLGYDNVMPRLPTRRGLGFGAKPRASPLPPQMKRPHRCSGEAMSVFFLPRNGQNDQHDNTTADRANKAGSHEKSQLSRICIMRNTGTGPESRKPLNGAPHELFQSLSLGCLPGQFAHPAGPAIPLPVNQ
jgi:hypothetical protein